MTIPRNVGHSSGDEMTIDEALDVWLDPRGLRYRRRLQKSSWRSARYLLHHLRRNIGGLDVDEIGPEHTLGIQAEMSEKGYKPETVNHVTHGVLLTLLSDLEANRLVGGHVRQRIKITRQLRVPKTLEVQHYSLAQRDRAIQFFAGGWAYPFVVFLFYTGARSGEAAGLRQRDIDWDRGFVRIERSRSGDEITPCKNANSQRTIPLAVFALEALRPLRKDGAPDELVFRNALGGKINVETFRASAWRRRLLAAGLPYINPHGTRHSWATNAALLGATLEEVAHNLGETPEVARAKYIHLFPRIDANKLTGGGETPPISPPPVTQVVAERRVPHLRLVKG